MSPAAMRLCLLCVLSAHVAEALRVPARAARLRMAEDSDIRKTMAKARRAAQQEGKGGFTPRAKGKRSEQKKPSSKKGFGAKLAAEQKFNRLPQLDAECACGIGSTYGDCFCRALHDGADAASPSELVRARYTAYKYRLPDYIMRTTDPDGSEYNSDAGAWKKDLLKFCVRPRRRPRRRPRLPKPRHSTISCPAGARTIGCPRTTSRAAQDEIEFQALRVGEESEVSGDGAGSATVAFEVDFVPKGTFDLKILKEKSTFRHDSARGGWLYADGEVDYEAQAAELTPEEQEKYREMVERKRAADAAAK